MHDTGLHRQSIGEIYVYTHHTSIYVLGESSTIPNQSHNYNILIINLNNPTPFFCSEFFSTIMKRKAVNGKKKRGGGPVKLNSVRFVRGFLGFAQFSVPSLESQN